MEYYKLNSGNKMPMEGIGTFLMESDDAETSVLVALQNGYELIDTANAYMNERAVGRAMEKSGKKREEIFLVTKLWPSVYEDETAVDETLKRLATDYIDLLLIHQPVGNYIKGYRQLEKAYKEGKAKAIGLSNFSIEQIKEIIDQCEVKPAMVQVEAHPYFPEAELKDFLKTYEIGMMAWYPLGHGDKELINEQIFTQLAEKYGKSNTQIILRWHIQSRNIIIPGSKNVSHIRANANIYDFVLSDDEMMEIAKLNQNKRYYNVSQEQAERQYTAIHPDFNNQK